MQSPIISQPLVLPINVQIEVTADSTVSVFWSPSVLSWCYRVAVKLCSHSKILPHLRYHEAVSDARVLRLCLILVAITHPRRVLNLDMKAISFICQGDIE